MPVRPLDAAVFLSSLALIALQVALMQALAEAQGHHFAYVVISLALLGFGSSGTVLALFRGRAMARANTLKPALLLLAGAGCVLALPAARFIAALADFPLLFVDWRAWLPLLFSAALAYVPFFMGALFLGLAFMCDTGSIGRLYAANLLGSALGAALGLALLFVFSAEQSFFLLGCVLALAALVLATLAGQAKRLLAGAGAGLFLLGLVGAVATQDFPVSAYKAVSHAMQLPEARVVEDRRHPMGRLQIVESPALRHAPGLSLHFAGEILPVPHLYRNGEGYGAFLPPCASEEHILDHGVQALPLALAEPESALVLHAGAGAGVGHLLSRPGVRVDAVEPHPVAARWLEKTYGNADGRLNVVVAQGRAFLGQSGKTHDLVLLPPQGAFGGGVGLQALQENYLLTQEAFLAMFSALPQDRVGLVALSAHLDQPPRQTLKLLSLMVQAMRQAGIEDLSAHVAAVRSWEMLSLVASSRPLGEDARQRLERFARTGGFDRVWVPGHGPAREDRFHLMLDDVLLEGFLAILQGDEAAFARDYLFEIAAPKDSRPYFHQFIRWDRFAEARQALGQDSLAFVEMGSILVALTVIILAAAAFLLILAPLLARQVRQEGKAPAGQGVRSGARLATLGYFGGIGLGFMFLEILWIQRFILFWAHPLHSAAGVIAALLCGMGAGSSLSARLDASPKTIRRILAAILLIIASSTLFLPWLMTAGLGWPGPVKWLVGLAFLAVPAVFLGMPFPLAVRLLGATRPSLVPWAWGINGCFSVLAAPLAVLTAMQAGFGAVAGTAAAAYLAALCSSCLTHKSLPTRAMPASQNKVRKIGMVHFFGTTG